MLWAERVDAWTKHPVTKAFFSELARDEERLKMTLITEAEEPPLMYRLQGMLKAYRGIIEIPLDGIPEPETKGVTNVTD